MQVMSWTTHVGLTLALLAIVSHFQGSEGGTPAPAPAPAVSLGETAGGSAPGVPSQLNTTQPLTRAQMMAQRADDPSNTDLLTSNPGLKACQKDSGSGECLNAMTDQLATMTQLQEDVESDLTNVAIQLNAVMSQQAGGNDKIANINSVIYGDGSQSNVGLINQLSTVTQSLRDVQETIKEQSTDIANKSGIVRTNTDATLQSIKKVMDGKLTDVEKQINDMLQGQATGQQADLVNSAQSMQQAVAGAQTTLSTNNANIKSRISALSDDTDLLISDTNEELGEIGKGTETNAVNIKSLQERANESLDALRDTMANETKAAVSSAVSQGAATLNASLTASVGSLNEISTQATSDLQSTNQHLLSDIDQAKAELASSLSDSQRKMQEADESNKKAISSFSSTSSAGVGALSEAQDAAGQQALNNAKATQDQLGQLSSLVKTYQQTSAESINSVQDKVNSLVSPLQQSVSDKLKGQGQATAEELLSINGNIASVLQGVQGSSSNSLSQLSKYIADAQALAGSDAAKQQSALGDTQSAIGTAKQLAESKMNVESDKASATLQMLMKVLGGSLEDTAGTVNEVNAANSAKQRALQNALQQQIVGQQSTLNEQVNAAKMQQQQALSSIQSNQAEKSQNVAKILADLMAVFGNVNSASQDSQNAITDLQSQMNQTQGIAASEIARLFNLMQSSQSAANASASGAQAQITLALSGMSDQMSQSMKDYANQFNGDFSGAVARLSNMSSTTLAQLQHSQSLQTNASSDAASVAKMLLADLSQLQLSGQGQIQALANIFQSQSLQAGLDRQAKLKAITDGAKGQMSDLEKKANAMIDSQSAGLAATTGQAVNNTLGQLSTLVDSLRAQQIAATGLASQTQGAVQSVQKWTSDLTNQINSAQDKVSTSKQAQLGILQNLQNQLSDWSSAIDKNISAAQQELQDGIAMIPNVTATKAADTERVFADSNSNMQKYLAQLKNAFDSMRATEAHYVQQQSLRRLSTLLGIDKASLDNSNVLMQLLGVTDLSQLGDATQIATVLGGLADGVSALQTKDGEAFADLQSQISNLDSNSKGLFAKLMNQASGSLTGLYSKYAADQHQLRETIAAAADTDRVRNQALNDALNGMLGSVRNGSMVLNGQLAKDSKDVYALDGSVRQLGDQSALAISRLIHSVQTQSRNADSAIAMSQKVNADRVASVRDVVIAFVQAMEEYVAGSRVGFDDIHTKLGAYKKFLENKLSVSDGYMLGMAQSTQSELSATADLAAALQNRITAFNARAKQQLYNVEEERSAIEARHEEELNELKTKLQNVTAQIHDDQSATSRQIEDWLMQESNQLDASVAIPEVAAKPGAVPDWARDDLPISLAEIRTHSPKEVEKAIKDNMEAIHREAQLVGITV
jgi:hypothetical protein